LPAALALARLVLCENRQGPSGDTSCEGCRACRKTSGYVHPDLHFAFPTVGSKSTGDEFLAPWREALRDSPYLEANDWLQRIGAENRQGNISRDACAAILGKLNLKIFEGRYKIMLVWLPEYLGNEGNRLLKVIEEPPDNTLFFLVAERPELILNTILSRCQLTRLHPPTDQEIAAALERDGHDAPRALTAARLAGGNVNQARTLVQRESDDHGQRLIQWMRACYSGSASQLIEWTDAFAKLGRESQKHFLRYSLHFWREFLLLSVRPDDTSAVRLPPRELSSATKLLPLVDPDQLAEITGLLSECAEHVERNANPKILFLDAGLRIHRILRTRLTPGGPAPAIKTVRSRA
jgi:DNA polymerase-3 subunit delta'